MSRPKLIIKVSEGISPKKIDSFGDYEGSFYHDVKDALEKKGLTKEEIIKETAEFYNLSNRGYDEKSLLCMYLTPDNKKCAVGRCILDEKIKSFNNVYVSDVISISDYLGNRGDSLDNYFKPEYRGHNVRFWRDLQSFHDSFQNWNEEGISDIGKSTMEILIDIHKEK